MLYDKREWRAALGAPSTCYLCSAPINKREATLDHVMPTSRGGQHDVSNVRWACRRCNSVKADLTLDELYDLAARLLAHRQRAQMVAAGSLDALRAA